MPALGQAILALHQRHQQAQERLETLALRLGDGRSDAALPPAMPFEVVRDFFFAHKTTSTVWTALPRRWPSNT